MKTPPKKNQPPRSHVFIVTYGRSGSTLLQAALNTIPGYLIRGENNNALLPLFRSWQSIATAQSMVGMRRSGISSQPTHPWYGGEKVNPDTLGRALARVFTRQVLCPDPDTRVCGFKEIRFHDHPDAFPHYLRFIRRFFPDSRFVFNTRAHADVARSGWWKTHDPETVSAKLTAAETLYRTYAEKHPDHTIAVHYDDYANAPEALKPLFDFLEAPMDMDRLTEVFATRLNHAREPEGKA